MGRFPVEDERCLAISREREEARLPPEAKCDVKRGYPYRPTLSFAGPPPIVLVERIDDRRGFVDRRLDLGQQREGHVRRRGTIPFAQHAATIARPPATPASTWYQAA